MSHHRIKDMFFDEPLKSAKKSVEKMTAEELRRERKELALDFEFGEDAQKRLDAIEAELSKRKLS